MPARRRSCPPPASPEAPAFAHGARRQASTQPRSQAALTAALAELHPYEVPEIVALEAGFVAPAYARWLLDAVRWS
jgi:hypothetical protein